MNRRLRSVLPAVLIVVLSLVPFRQYLTGLVPFPANLLASYYDPWKSYPVPEYPNGPPNKAMGFDTLRIYYPVRSVTLRAWDHHEPPLWNPYNFSGNVLHGTYQSAVFHPLSFLYDLLPQIDAWSVVVMLQPLLSSALMYLLLGVFGVSRRGRLVGALAYAFSGFFMVWWQEDYMFTYAAMMLPPSLYAIERYRSDRRSVWLAMLAVCLGLSVLSGAFQMTFYAYAFTAVWLLYRTPRSFNAWVFFLSGISAMLLSLLLASVHLLPGLEAYRMSARAASDIRYIFEAHLLPLTQLVTMIAPDYFGNPATYNYFYRHGFYHERLVWLGIVPLALILTQLFRRQPHGPHGRFFRAAFFVSLSLVFALPTTWFILYSLKLPLVSTMTPSRMMMIVAFTGAVIAANAADEYRKGFSRRTLFFVSTILLLSYAAAAAVPPILKHFDDKNTTWIIQLRNLVIPGASTVVVLTVLWISRLRPRLRDLGYVALLTILSVNAYLFAHKYLYVSERRFVFPDVPVLTELKKRAGYNRFWSYQNGYIGNNFASQYGLYSPEGYDSIMIRRYAEFLGYANSRGTTRSADRANALIQSTDLMGEILNDPYRERALRLLGVKYIARSAKSDPNEHLHPVNRNVLPRVWEDGTYAIHEFRDSLPRAKLYSDIRVEPDGGKLLDGLFSGSTDIGKTLYVEQEASLPKSIIPLLGTARITGYTPNTVTVAYASTVPALLFLSDAYAPGWNAYVNGKRSEVLRADYAFRAVTVPRGIGTVVFRYQPRSWSYGVAGTFVGLLILAGLLIPEVMRKKRLHAG